MPETFHHLTYSTKQRRALLAVLYVKERGPRQRGENPPWTLADWNTLLGHVMLQPDHDAMEHAAAHLEAVGLVEVRREGADRQIRLTDAGYFGTAIFFPH